MTMIRSKCVFILCVVLLSGCSTFVKHSPQFTEKIKNVKTIAVMPPDVKVYQLKAGGVQEEIDEWSQIARKHIETYLKKHFGDKYHFELKFISREWLEENLKDIWKNNRALYEAVAISALRHSFSGSQAFDYKIKNFEYTLGSDIQELSQALKAQSILFVNGYDYEATLGRTMMEFWTMTIAAVGGVSIIYQHPSFLNLGLVDGQTGELTWLSVSPTSVEYSFRSEKHMDALIEWITRNFYPKTKK